jgi:hypothetical protein
MVEAAGLKNVKVRQRRTFLICRLSLNLSITGCSISFFCPSNPEGKALRDLTAYNYKLKV